MLNGRMISGTGVIVAAGPAKRETFTTGQEALLDDCEIS